MVQLGVAGMLGTSIPTKTNNTNITKDNALSGVGGIKGVGTGSGMGVKKETNTVAPVVESVKNIPPTTTGRIKKSSTEDKPMVLAAIDILQGQKTADEISKEYAGKLSSDSFSKTIDLITDISNGSGLVELNKAYSDIPRLTIDDIFQAHNSIKNPQNNPGVIKNFVTGFLGELPTELANTASYVFKNIINPNGALLDIFNIKDNSVVGKATDKVTNSIKQLGKEAKMEIDAHIGGDETTKMYKGGQIIMDILPALLTRKPGQQLGAKAITSLEEASTKFPKLLEFIRNPKVNRLVQNIVSSIPQTEAITIASEGKSSSPKELAAGAIFNSIIPNKVAKNKEGVLNLIKEQVTDKNVGAALDMGTLKPLPTGLNKFWNGIKDMVKPSKKTYDAVNTITTEIKDFSKDPQTLYTQLKNKVYQIGDAMKGKLSTVDVVGGQNLQNLSTTFDDTISYLKDSLGSTIAKKATQLKSSIVNASNANEVWEANKLFNKLVPDNIKKGIGLNGKDQLIYTAWIDTQKAVNEYIQSSAETLGHTDVAEGFKKMSNMLFAQGQIKENAYNIVKTSKGLKQRLGALGQGALKLWALSKILGVDGKSGVDSSQE